MSAASLSAASTPVSTLASLFARPRAKHALAIGLALLMTGCGAATQENKAGPLIETATVDGARRSIDPAYVIPAEDRAPEEANGLSQFTRSAAKIAIQERKIYGAAAHLATLYDEDPTDKRVAFDLARHLRYTGAVIAAESVLTDALAIHGPDPVLMLEKGKVLIAAGRPGEARPILRGLLAELPNDPGVLQAAAIAEDRLGDHTAAQALYDRALQQGRPSAALLNNAGLSRLIAGDAPGAIALFRRAAAAPGATAQVRMNLALALSLQGETAEAQRLAASATPEEVAADAVAFYSQIGAPAHAWSLAAGG